MKRFAPCLLAVMLCLLAPLSAQASVLADNWQDASLAELYAAQAELEARIEQLEAEPRAEEAGSTGWKPGSDDVVVYEDAHARITWKGLNDTMTSGMDFQPVLFLQNKSTDRSLTLDPETIYINNHKMSVSNFSSLTLEPGCKLSLGARYSWLISSEDLLDAYNEDTIRSFELTYDICDENDRVIASDQLFSIDLDVNVYELMGGNSSFNRKYPRE